MLVLLAVVPRPAYGEEPTEEQVTRAKRLHEKGARHYKAGRYERAAGAFRTAIAAADRPSLHFNLARAYEKLDRPAEAVAEYRAYLEAEPGTSRRKRIETKIRKLRARLAAATFEAAEAPEPPPEPEPTAAPPEPEPARAAELPQPEPEPPWQAPPAVPPPPSPLPAYLSFGLAGAAAVATGVLGALAWRAKGDLDAATVHADTPSERARIDALADSAASRALAADVLGVTTLLAAGMGAWLLFVPPSGAEPTSQ